MVRTRENNRIDYQNEAKEQIKYNPFEKVEREEHFHPKLLKLEVNQTKITAYLKDKREISIPITELAKRWRKPNLKAEQLKDYEIFPDHFSLNFPIADIYTNVLIFTGNYCGCC